MKQSSLLFCLSAGLCQLAGAVPAAELNFPRDTSHIEARADSNALEHVSLDARQASDCRRGLSCSYDYIESQPMPWRQGYLRTIQDSYLTRYNSGNQCRNLEGIIQVLIELRIGAPRTWYSCQNAGLIEAIQNAAANINGVHSRDGGNPGTRLWSTFFRRMRSGGYSDRNQHDIDWTACEETSSEYGRQIGEQRRRYRPTQPERTCQKTTQSYRYVMRNRSQSSSILRSVLGIQLGGGGLIGSVTNIVLNLNIFINVLTDVGSSKSGYDYYKVGNSDIEPGDYNKPDSEIVRDMGPELYDAYQGDN